VLISNLGGPAMLLHNQGHGGHWLTVDVRENNGGPLLSGARVSCTAGGKTQRAEVQASAGFAGSNDPRVHFGLGTYSESCEIEIRWPDGTVTRQSSGGVDRILTATHLNAGRISKTGRH